MIRLLLVAALVLGLALPAAAQSTATLPDVQTVRLDSIAVGGSGMGGPVGPFTFVSLTDSRIVPNADSASTAWDLALRGTTIRVNGGTSGPGQGAARLVEAAFEDVTSAADLDLILDGEGDCPRGDLAICTGSGNGWYLYASNGVEPLADRTLVVRTAMGGHAKVRVLRYVLSDPQPDGSRPRYYTLEVAPLDTPLGD